MKKRIWKRILCLLLCAGAVWSLAGSPPVTAKDFNIDGTGFSDPEVTSGIMYFWKKGLPPTGKSFDSAGNILSYPILITWDDTYYWCTDLTFRNKWSENGNSTAQMAGVGRAIDWYTAAFRDYNFPCAFTHFNRQYPMSSEALLSKLDFWSELKSTGNAVSMTRAEVPYAVSVNASKLSGDTISGIWSNPPFYCLYIPEESYGYDTVADYWWIVGRHYYYSVNNENKFDSNGYDTSLDWYLGSVGSTTLENARNEFLNPNWSRRDVSVFYEEAYSLGKDRWEMANRSWMFGGTADSCYIRTYGIFQADAVSWENSGEKDRNQNWIKNISYHTRYIDLYHKGNTLWSVHSKTALNGSDGALYDGSKDKFQNGSTANFKIYYAEPNIVSFYQTSFTVEEGQVVNLDGPAVIGTECQINVKDGGVLVCSGWVVNNGCIKVEPGGTLIIQERETATGDSQYGAVSSVGLSAGSECGCILCDGLMIVNPNCKAVGAGIYGLQFGQGATVVNYGNLISENFTVRSEYTIENRGASSSVFMGWGVTDTGYALSRTKISGTDYSAKGVREKTAAVTLAPNAVYGDGANRCYRNTARSVKFQEKKQTGYVGMITWKGIEEIMYSRPKYRPDAVYLDERYHMYWFTDKQTGIIYSVYQDLAGSVLWSVAIGDSIEVFEMAVDLAAVAAAVPAALPDGYQFVLYGNRITVGETPAMEEPADIYEDWDMYYDQNAGVFFFYDYFGDCYYWEKQLERWLYVFVEYRSVYIMEYTGRMAPPPDDPDFPVRITRSSLPEGYMTYSDAFAYDE